MTLNIKEGVDFTAAHERAARKRVENVAHLEIPAQQLQDATRRTLEQQELLKPIYGPVPGGVFSSHKAVQFLRNAAMHHGMLASKSEQLSQEVLRSSDEHLGILDEVQKAAASLDSLVNEDEIKAIDQFTNVHYNAFIRSVDFGLEFQELPWTRDWKTELPFLADNMAYLQPEAGVSLPLLYEERIAFLDVKLLGEGTDVGDTSIPVVSQDPRRLMIPGQTFRHVVARRRFDSTSRKYKKESVVVTLLIELPGLQYVNSLNVRPASYSTFFLQKLSYINDLGLEAELDVTDLEADRSIHVLFEPVVARYLKLELVQHSPVEQGQVTIADDYNHVINEVLSDVGWSQTLPDTSEQLSASIYDFSIEEITASLRTYNSLGVYVARPLEVNNLSGIVLDDDYVVLDITEDQRTYGDRFFLPSGEALLERYVGFELTGANGQVVLNELVPARDGYPYQQEVLPIFGREAKAKLFPDLLVEDLMVGATAVLSAGVWQLNLTSAIDNLVVDPSTWITDGDLILGGPPGHILNGRVTEYLVLSDTEVWVKIGGSGFTDNIGGNTFPGLFVGLLSNLTADPSALPVLVKEGSTALNLGVDYQVTLDGGSSWVSDWPNLIVQYLTLDEYVAGRFQFRFTSPNYASIYWATYAVEQKQFVSESKLVRLINGNIVLDKSVGTNNGSVYMCYVLRAHHSSSYLTPVLLSYSLKLRERNGS